MSQAATVKVSIDEIFRMMDFGKPTDTIYDNFANLDAFTAKDLATAEEFLGECDKFQQMPRAVIDPAQGLRDFSQVLEANPRRAVVRGAR